MSAAGDLFAAVFETPEGCSQAEFRRLMDAYKAEVQREDAAIVRAQAPKYLDSPENIAVFLALDKAAALIEPDKK